MDGLSDPANLVAVLYRAVADPSAWTDVLQVLCERMRCDAMTLLFIDVVPRLVVRLHNFGYAAPVLDGYQREFVLDDPRWDAALGVEPRQWRESSITLFEPDRGEFCHWYRNQGWDDQFAGLSVVVNDDIRAVLLADFLERNPFDRGQNWDLAQPLIANLELALRASIELSSVRLQHSIAVGMLDRIGAAVAVLDEKGRLLHFNKELERLLEDGDFTADRGYLISTFRPSQRVFSAFVGQVLDQGSTPDALVITLNRRSGKRPLTVRAALTPLSGREGLLARRLLTMVITDSDTCKLPEPRMLGSLLNLSERQAELTRMLASGLSLAEAASNMGVKEKTARTHLEMVLRKTCTHRQSELVCLVHQCCGSISF